MEGGGGEIYMLGDVEGNGERDRREGSGEGRGRIISEEMLM